jgi:hypothetical protein
MRVAIRNREFTIKALGVLAQLVERLNGIEEVRGSNPLGSKLIYADLRLRDHRSDQDKRSTDSLMPSQFSPRGSGAKAIAITTLNLSTGGHRRSFA